MLLVDFDATTYLPQIDKKVRSLVVHGNEDLVIGQLHAFLLQDLLGKESCHLCIPKCDHILWISHGHELEQAAREFYDESE